MFNLKRTAMVVLAFSSHAVFAGTMGPACSPGGVTVPCVSSAWEFGGQALYLQSRYSGVGFLGNVQNAVSPASASKASYPALNDNWGWGFKLDAAYHFYTGNDLNLNWYHYSEKTERTVIVPIGGVFTDNVTNEYNGTVNASRRPHWDAVNLEFGQHVDFSEHTAIRFHGGVQYVRINTQESFFSPNSSMTTSNDETITYNGFGPRVGLDMTYNWGNGLAMYANSATALFIGPSSFKDIGVGPAGPTWYALSGSTTAIVPEVEIKLGATYTYAMSLGNLTLDAGWMWLNYFNAQQNSGGGFGMQESDFGLQGPYIGLKWLGNIA